MSLASAAEDVGDFVKECKETKDCKVTGSKCCNAQTGSLQTKLCGPPTTTTVPTRNPSLQWDGWSFKCSTTGAMNLLASIGSISSLAVISSLY